VRVLYIIDWTLTVDNGKEKPAPAKKPAKKASKPTTENDVAKKAEKSSKKEIPSETIDPAPAEAQQEPSVPADEETAAKPAKARGRPKKPVPEGGKLLGRPKKS